MVVVARAALAAAVVSSVIALTDALSVAVTGEGSAFTTGPAWLVHASAGAHGVMFAFFAALLVGMAEVIDGGSRARQWCRRALVVLFVLLAVPYLSGVVIDLSEAPAALSVPMTVGFVASFPVSAALGVMLLRRSQLRLPALVLTSVLGAFALVIVLGVVAPSWAHPGYLEVAQYLGIALLGRRRAADPVTARVAVAPPVATA